MRLLEFLKLRLGGLPLRALAMQILGDPLDMGREGTQTRDFLSDPPAFGALALERGQDGVIAVCPLCRLSPRCLLGPHQPEPLELSVRDPPVTTVLDGSQLAALDPLAEGAYARACQLGGLLSRVGLHAVGVLHVPSVPFQVTGDKGDKDATRLPSTWRAWFR